MAAAAQVLFPLLALALAAFARGDDACPPEADIAPCTCDGEGFSCLGNINIEQIRKAFRANFKYGGVKALWVQATPITSVPQDLFNNIMVQEAYIEMTNATFIDLRSLRGSKETVYILSLFGNKLTTFDYDNLKDLDIITTLNIGKNQLTSIPDNGFKSFFLRNLILAQNQISSIGRNAFTGLDNIAYIDLSSNAITTLGPQSFALKSTLPQINVMANLISEVSPTAFENTTPQIIRLAANRLTTLKYEAFGDLVTRMAQHGGLIDTSANPFTCRGCDYSWLAKNKMSLLRVILGFSCPNGAGLDHLTTDNIGC